MLVRKTTIDGADQCANTIDNHHEISFVNQHGAVPYKAASLRESQSTLSVYFSYIKTAHLLVNPNSFLF